MQMHVLQPPKFYRCAAGGNRAAQPTAADIGQFLGDRPYMAEAERRSHSGVHSQASLKHTGVASYDFTPLAASSIRIRGG